MERLSASSPDDKYHTRASELCVKVMQSRLFFFANWYTTWLLMMDIQAGSRFANDIMIGGFPYFDMSYKNCLCS